MVGAKWAGLKHGGDRKSDGIKSSIGDLKSETKTREEAAMDWMDANQLGRRNLTKEAHDLLLGRRYNRTKRQGARTDITLDQSDTKSEPQNTAAKLATEHGVSEATVKRARPEKA